MDIAIACQPVECPENVRRGQKHELALAVARGDSVADWARENNVPRRTAFRWYKQPKVKAAVDSCRERSLDQAIGRLAENVTSAADGIVELSKQAKSEPVRLAALKAVFSNIMAVTAFSGMEKRMTQIEEKLRDGTGNTTRTG